MSKLRSISTGIWSDPFIEDLSTIDKLLFIYLISNEKTNMLGIYESSIKKISFETGIKKEDVEKGFIAFEKANKIKRVGNYIILVNYIKNQNYNTNMKKSAIAIYNSLPNSLRTNLIEIKNDDKQTIDKAFETLSKCLVMVRKEEVEYKFEEEVEDEEEQEEDKISFSKEIEDLYLKIYPLFDLKARPKNEKQVNNWKDCLLQCNEKDGYTLDEIYSLIYSARNDSFWKTNFISLLKLQKPNKEGVKYIDVFNIKFGKPKDVGKTNQLEVKVVPPTNQLIQKYKDPYAD